MRRMMALLGVAVLLQGLVGCYCVAGKCDCTGDKIITHPYSMCREVNELLSISPHHHPSHGHGEGHDAHLPGGVGEGAVVAPAVSGSPTGVPAGVPVGVPVGGLPVEKLPPPKGS